MTNKKVSKEDIIDYFYDEKDIPNIDELLDNDRELYEFEEKLHITKSRLDMIDDDSEMDINILGIISKAEAIQDDKKEKKETLLFIIIAFIILLSFAIITLILGDDFFITIEVIIFIFLPFVTIPMTKSVLK